MNVIYVGDSNRSRERVRGEHVGGNVEGSPVRRRVAKAWGWPLSVTKRPSSYTRTRVGLDDPKLGERQITEYIQAGYRKAVECKDYDEAHDFQWYCIEQLQPSLNHEAKPWDHRKVERYESLLGRLEQQPLLDPSKLGMLPTGPGVYALYHDESPQTWSSRAPTEPLRQVELDARLVEEAGERHSGAREILAGAGLALAVSIALYLWLTQPRAREQLQRWIGPNNYSESDKDPCF